MIRSRSNDRAAQQPVFTSSHAKQEKICQEVYDYLTRVKMQKLKAAVQRLNKIIKQMLK
jgi:chemotaxis protein histidine kinase CheA